MKKDRPCKQKPKKVNILILTSDKTEAKSITKLQRGMILTKIISFASYKKCKLLKKIYWNKINKFISTVVDSEIT